MKKIINILTALVCLIAIVALPSCTSQSADSINIGLQARQITDSSRDLLSGDVGINTTESQEVFIPDANLEAVIRGIIGKPEGTIYDTDLKKVIALEAYHKNISDLTGIEYCTNLKEAYLSYNNITDLTPLSRLPGGWAGDGENRFTTLHISLVENPINDLSPLKDLIAPDELTLVLDRTGVSNLTALGGLSNLICLYANQNGIKEIPQNGWGKLSNLSLWDNKISNISHLSNAISLRYLNLEDNNISDISCLDSLTGLETVKLNGNPVKTSP